MENLNSPEKRTSKKSPQKGTRLRETGAERWRRDRLRRRGQRENTEREGNGFKRNTDAVPETVKRNIQARLPSMPTGVRNTLSHKYRKND